MHLSPKTRSFFPLPSLGFLHTNRLAGVPQGLRKTFWCLRGSRKSLEKLFGLCRNAAKATKNFLASAGMLQTPKWRKGLLQDFCKRQNGEKRPCRSSAKAKMEKSALAEVLQTSKWRKARLQKFCKRQNGEKRPCRSSANAKMGKSVLAEVLQRPKWRKRRLQKFCKGQNGGKRPCRSSANATRKGERP